MAFIRGAIVEQDDFIVLKGLIANTLQRVSDIFRFIINRYDY